MTAYRQSHRSAILFLSSLLLAAAPGLMPAQNARGTVKANPLTVYADMSAASDVIATLTPGQAVQITFSVTNGEGTWCSISDVDTSKKIGFVQCDGLDRQNAPSTAAAGPGTAFSAPVYQSSSDNGTPSRTQKQWAIAASAILSVFNHERLDTLSSDDSVIRVRALLQNSWSISNHDELLQTLAWIDQGGHRKMFSTLGARSANLSQEQLSNVIRHLNSEDANSLMVAHRYYAKYSTQSITAWDYARYINVCRWSVAAGYLTEDEAWPRVMHAAAILQQTFNSWSEFGDNYLVGREFWSLSQTRIDGQEMRAVYERLLNDRSSTWNRIPWSLPLEQSGSAAPNLPANSPETQSAKAGTAEGRCGALQHALAGGHASDVESILQAEPTLIGCRDSHGWTPLHEAAFYRQTGMIGSLTEHGAAVDAADKDGATPLHVAASEGSADAIEALAKSGARIDATDRHGDTPLVFAAKAGHAPATEMLLQYHAKVDARCSCDGGTALNAAAANGYTDVVRLLLDHGANIESRDQDGFTALSVAAWFGHADMVALLLDHNANANARANDGSSPLQGTAKMGFPQIATLLLEHGAKVSAGNGLGFTPLHIAAEHDQIEVIEVLLAHGASIDETTNAGDTPLHWAAHENKLDAARFLLGRGAELDPKDRDGNTPLHFAAAMGHVEMTELLIAHGADLKARTRLGCTPLRGAYDFHQAATARALLQHGATQ